MTTSLATQMHLTKKNGAILVPVNQLDDGPMKHVAVAMCAIVLGVWPVFADCPATLAEQWVVNPSNSEANGQPAVLATYDTEDSYVITWARMLFGSPLSHQSRKRSSTSTSVSASKTRPMSMTG